MKPHCFLAVPFVSGTDTSKASRLDNEKAVPGYYSVAHSCYGSSFELSTDKYTARRREQELDIRSTEEISENHGWKFANLKKAANLYLSFLISQCPAIHLFRHGFINPVI